MKWIVLLCLLAVYSARAMPNMEEEEQVPIQDVEVESYIENEEEEEENVVKSRVKRDMDDPNMPPNIVDVDVNVDVNVAKPNIYADVDVNVNVNAENEDEENGSVTYQPKTAACDCSASLKQQAADLAREGNQLLDTLQELKNEAAANNGTAVIGPRRATAIVTHLEESVNKTAADLKKSWEVYCEWKWISFWWFWGYWKWVCGWRWSGRKRRAVDFEISEDEVPTCITSHLDVALADIEEQIAVATELKDIVINDPVMSAFILGRINQAISMLKENLPFINDLILDLNELPC